MGESREIRLSSLVKSLAGELVAFTEVKEENNSVYFTLAGHRFRTVTDRVFHSGSNLFASSFTDYLAERETTPEGIENHRKMMDQVNEELDDLNKYGDEVMEIVIVQAVKVLNDKGRDEFIKFLDSHFHFTLEDEGKKLMKFVKAVRE